MSENMTSSNKSPEGMDLLGGLYTVYQYLQDTNEKLTRYWELERYYREEVVPSLGATIEVNTSTEKTQYGLFVAGMAFAGLFGFIGLLGGGVANFIFCLVIVGVFAFGKTKQNKKFLNAGFILLALLLLTWLKGVFNALSMSGDNLAGLAFYLAVNITAFVVASIVARILLKKYNSKIEQDNKTKQEEADGRNREIRQHNEHISQQRKDLANEIHALLAQMQTETADWYPPDYYVIECCSKFISYVKNHEADTVKEMIKIYKEDKYREQIITKVSSIESKVDQSLNNQQEMIRLQRVSNLIQMGNAVVNMANNQAINRGADAAERGAYAAERSANSAAEIARKLKR